MIRLDAAAVLALLVTALLTGGVLVRAVRLAATPRAAIVLGLVVAAVGGVALVVARSRAPLDSPYW